MENSSKFATFVRPCGRTKVETTTTATTTTTTITTATTTTKRLNIDLFVQSVHLYIDTNVFECRSLWQV